MVIFPSKISKNSHFLMFFQCFSDKFSNGRGASHPGPPSHARLSFTPVFPILLLPARDKISPYATDP